MAVQVESPHLIFENDCEEVVHLGKINFIYDYIESPEASVQKKIEELMRAVKKQVQNILKFEEPPYISQIFGRIREDAYIKYNNITSVHSGNKKIQYKRLFYKDVDLKFENLFKQLFSLKEKYREEVVGRKYKITTSKTIDLNLEDSGLLLF